MHILSTLGAPPFPLSHFFAATPSDFTPYAYGLSTLLTVLVRYHSNQRCVPRPPSFLPSWPLLTVRSSSLPSQCLCFPNVDLLPPVPAFVVANGPVLQPKALFDVGSLPQPLPFNSHSVNVLPGAPYSPLVRPAAALSDRGCRAYQLSLEWYTSTNHLT